MTSLITTDNPDSASLSDKIYFADEEYGSTKFSAATFAFADAYTQWVTDTGLDTRWTQNACLYAGADPSTIQNGMWDADTFSVIGDNGELLSANYNDMRNLLQHILNICVAQPPGMMAKAINDEEASLIAAETFDGVFNYYLTTHKSGRLLKQSRQSVEYALYLDSGFMLAEWDETLGKPMGVKTQPTQTIDPQTGAPTMTQTPVLDERGQEQLEYEGDLYFKARSPWDVFFDPGCEDEDEADWVLVRDQVNKYEYARQYPEFASRILSSSDATTTDRMRQWRRGFKRSAKTNLIQVWKFYHRPTCGMPKGRHAILLDAATVLKDGPSKYDRLPLFHVKAMEGLGTITGYAPANVIAPVQMSQNILSSAMMTNYAMFGVQNVAVKDTDQFDVTEIAGSMNVLRYADTPPTALQLAAQANGIGDWYEALGRKGETLSGVNSVVRGDPETSLKSGKALGIVQAAAVQFQSALAASYAQFLKDIGNFMLYCFRNFIKAERVTQIIGKNERMQSATWDSDTFGPIDRVEAELIDPAMRTLGYRTDQAMFLAQNFPQSITPQEFLTVLQTGQFKPMIRRMTTELNLVHQENADMVEVSKNAGPAIEQMTAAVQQAMAVGNQVLAQQLDAQLKQTIDSLTPPVSLTDDDELHLNEHGTVGASPATRRNSTIMAIKLAHDQKHRDNIVAKAIQQAQMQLQIEAAGMQMRMQMGLMPAEQTQGQDGDQKSPQNKKQDERKSA